jgi:predicted MFS family arabinose efflux permease
MPAVEVQADDVAQTASRLRSPRWLVLALGLGVFFAGFDQTFVVTILPNMMSDLSRSTSSAARPGSSTATCWGTPSRCP